MTLFKILWSIDAIACLVVVYFFFVGLNDKSVSSKNMGLWMGILCMLAVVMLGSVLLRQQYQGISLALLWIIAIPALFYLLFLLVVILGKGKWN